MRVTYLATRPCPAENFYSQLLHDGTCLFYQLTSGMLLNISAAAKKFHAFIN
jgi:hypothetical protein